MFGVSLKVFKNKDSKTQGFTDSVIPLPGSYLTGLPMRRANSMPTVCTFFLQGYCARGNSCKYAHILNPEVMGDRVQLEGSRLPYFAEMQSNANYGNSFLKNNKAGTKPRMLECEIYLLISSPSLYKC